MTKKIIHIFNRDKYFESTLKLFSNFSSFLQEHYILDQYGLFHYDQNKKYNISDLTNEINVEKPLVFIHGLDQHKQQFVNLLDQNISIAWLVWGYDLYGEWHFLKHRIYDKNTKELLYTRGNITRLKYNIIYSQIGFLLFKHYRFFKNYYSTNYLSAVEKIKYFFSSTDAEYKLAKKINSHLTGFDFQYVCLDYIKENDNKHSLSKRPNILVGNSADPSNNHLSVFKILSKKNLTDTKIIVPLSYGGNKAYKDKIMLMGYKLLGKSFMPLIDYMPLDEYHKIISSCGIAIFNHHRQQAQGNIALMIDSGVQVYLNKKNPIYNIFRQKKISVKSFEELKKPFEVLSLKEIRDAKKFVNEFYGEQHIKKQIEYILKKIQ